jgi:hypothetical protein
MLIAASRLAVLRTQPLIQLVPGSLHQRHEPYHFPRSSIEAKNMWSFICTLLYAFIAWCLNSGHRYCYLQTLVPVVERFRLWIWRGLRGLSECLIFEIFIENKPPSPSTYLFIHKYLFRPTLVFLTHIANTVYPAIKIFTQIPRTSRRAKLTALVESFK